MEGFARDNPWTVYFLVDLKVVFIITYIYATVINLVSSTANIEATEDTDSGQQHTVAPYTNATVTKIDDAVLWSCRYESMTKEYYRFLYWMIIIALIVALSTFCIVKIVTLVRVGVCESDKHSLTKLWQMALLKYLKKSNIYIISESDSPEYAKAKPSDNEFSNPTNMDQREGDTEPTNADDETVSANKKDETETVSSTFVSLEKVLDLLNKDTLHKSNSGFKMSAKKIRIPTDKKICKILILCCLALLLIAAMAFFHLSYDLHPLACIAEPREEDIVYKSTKTKVEIKFRDGILIFQKVAFGIVGFLMCLYLFLAYRFYRNTEKMVECILEENLKDIEDDIKITHTTATTTTTTTTDLIAEVRVCPTQQDTNNLCGNQENILHNADHQTAEQEIAIAQLEQNDEMVTEKI